MYRRIVLNHSLTYQPTQCRHPFIHLLTDLMSLSHTYALVRYLSRKPQEANGKPAGLADNSIEIQTHYLKDTNLRPNVTVFWDVMHCSLVGSYQRFETTCFLRLQTTRIHLLSTLKTKAVDFSETLVDFYPIHGLDISEDSDLRIY